MRKVSQWAVWVSVIVSVFSIKSFAVDFDPTTSLVNVASGTLNAAKTQLTITSTDVPDNVKVLYGPLTINFPANQNLNLPWPYRGGTDGGSSTHTSIKYAGGTIGITVAGLVVYSSANGSVITKNGTQWNYDANAAGINGEDIYGGHCSNIGGGQYHYHDIAFITNNSWVGVTGFSGNSYRQADGHSKLMGWSADGYPIYGPYGYIKPTDPTSGVQTMVSGYTTTSTGANRPSSVTTTVSGAVNNSATVVFASDPGALGLNPGMRITTNSAGLAANTYYILNQKNVTYVGGGHPPYTGANNSVLLNSAVTIANGASVTFEYLPGLFIEDSTFTNTGTLDVYNGRWCVTPEYPNGTYAYFMTGNANGKGAYPYILGQSYYGSQTVSNNYTWNGGSGTWGTGTGGWDVGAWADGNNVIIGKGTETPGTIMLSSTVNPAAINFAAPQSGGYTLIVNGSIATLGTIVVGSGVTIRGTNGNIARSIQTTSSGTVWPGTSALGSAVAAAGEVLNVGGLDMSAGTLKIALNASTAASTQKLNVNGACKVGGTLSLGIPAGTTSANAYTIVSSTGALSGTFSTIRLNGVTVTGNSPISVQYTANAVTVTVTGGVTPATIGQFSAIQEGAGVKLEWEAVSEYHNLGFNIYRRTVATENWIRINPVMVAGRITNPDLKVYQWYDWPPVGECEYRLESVSITGEVNSCENLAGPLSIEEVVEYAQLPTGDGVAAANGSVLKCELNMTASKGLPSPIQGRSIERFQQSKAGHTSTKGPSVCPASPAVRWLTNAGMSKSSAYSAVKVEYSKPGVLLISRSELPAGCDLDHVSIEREERTISALAVNMEGLVLFGEGYHDEYTNRDSLFLRSRKAPTTVVSPGVVHGLFDQVNALAVTAPAQTQIEYHDVYFDYDRAYGPYTYEPWFSDKYLMSGTAHAFTLNAPAAMALDSELTVRAWSVTTGDHALQVGVNGTMIGETGWHGGNQLMEWTFRVPASVLKDGPNVINLVTPQSEAQQVSFLHLMSLNYTRALDSSTPLDLYNTGVSAKLFELSHVPSAKAWVVDARFPDRAALAAYETQAQPDGTFKLRFHAQPGGSGHYVIVPHGQENRPDSISQRTVRAPRAANYLATGPAQFAAGVQPLLLQRAKEGLRTAFAGQNQLFDYYNFGRYGPAGIQRAVRAVRPQYLLLLGRTTYDYKNYENQNVDPLCPAFLAATSAWAQATSDSQFGDLGRGHPEVAVGRLPVNNALDLGAVVGHILAYTGAPESGVRVHAATDRADPITADFPAQAQTLSQSFPEKSWQMNALGVTHNSAQEVTDSLRAAASGGADWLLYVGHGNASKLGKDDPRILDTNSVQSWSGSAVLLQATCTAHWMAKNENGFQSIAMRALTHGGIAASVGTSTYMVSDCAVDFMTQLMRKADFSGTRWGDALLETQQWASAKGKSAGNGLAKYYQDLSATESLFGDPAMPVFAKTRGTTLPTRAALRSLRAQIPEAPKQEHQLSVDAIQSIRQAGRREDVPALRDVLKGADPLARIAAMLALSEWNDDESRDAFERASRSDDPRVRVAGENALARLDALERFVPYPKQTPETLAVALKSGRANVRHEAAMALLRYGSNAKACLAELIDALSQVDGNTRATQVVPYLANLQAMGADGAAAGKMICALLNERAALYSGRAKHEVHSLRAHLLVTLADIGQTDKGLNFIVDTLANSDAQSMESLAAGAYAAGKLGENGAMLEPFLARALERDGIDAEPRQAHGGDLRPALKTSARMEIQRALDLIRKARQ